MLTTVIRDLNNGLGMHMYGSPRVDLLAPNQILISNISSTASKVHENLRDKAIKILEKHSLKYLFLERRSGGYIIAVYNTPQEQLDANTVKLALLMEYELELQKQMLVLQKQRLEISKHLLKLKTLKGNNNENN